MTTPTELGPDLPLNDGEVLAALVGLDAWDQLTEVGVVAPVDVALVERIASTVSTARPARDPGHRTRAQTRRPARSHPRWYVAAAALVAAVTAVVVVVPTLGDQPTQVAEAAVLLDRAAASVAADPIARPGQWWRVTTTTVGLGVAGGEQTSPQRIYRLAQTDVRYLPVAGAAAGYLVVGPRRYLAQVSGPTGPLPSPAPGAVLSELPLTADPDDPWAAPTAEWLAALPRDPAALRETLASFGPGRAGGDAETALSHAASVLQSGLAPADLRRAVLQALAGYGAELEVVRGVALGGRTGVAVGVLDTESNDPTSRAVVPENGLLTQLVLDPATAEVLGTRSRTVGDVGLGVPSGSVMLEIGYDRTLVDAVPEDVVRRAAENAGS